MESSNGASTLETSPEVQEWSKGCANFDAGEFSLGLLHFHTALEHVQTAKLNFNIAQTHLNLGSIEDAIAALSVALQQDPFLAVAYFQRGVCYYQFCDWNRAAKDFGSCIQALRGNMVIDYAQLGLSYRLYACEPTYNLGLANFCLRNTALALTMLQSAEKLLPLLDRPREYYANVDKALKMGQGCEGDLDLYMCPLRCIYRPIKTRSISITKTQPAAQPNPQPQPDSQPVSQPVSQPISQPASQTASVNVMQTAQSTDTPAKQPTLPPKEPLTLSQEVKQEYERRTHAKGVSESLSDSSFVEKELKAAAQLLSSVGKPAKSERPTKEQGDRAEKVKSVEVGKKLRIKLHSLPSSEIYTLLLTYPITFNALKTAITKKTGLKTGNIKWRDEEGDMLVMVDDDDLDVAVSRDKIELWVG